VRHGDDVGDRITIDTITYGFDQAIAGAPLIAIGTSAVGAALIAIGDRTRHRKLLGAAGVACQALAIAALVPWANNPLAWNGAIEFRTFAAVVILPMALIAVLDGWREPPASSPWRQFAAVTASAGFALIMTVQGLSVQALDGSMMDAIRAANGGCTPQESIAGVNGTMLDSWATPSRSLLFGSRTATTIVLPGDKCPLLTVNGQRRRRAHSRLGSANRRPPVVRPKEPRQQALIRNADLSRPSKPSAVSSRQ
jgi:hypothetical protein